MSTENQEDAAVIRREDHLPIRLITDADEAIAAVVAGFPVHCSAEVGWNTSSLRRPEGERQAALDLKSDTDNRWPPGWTRYYREMRERFVADFKSHFGTRMCYDYAHGQSSTGCEPKHWEIDE